MQSLRTDTQTVCETCSTVVTSRFARVFGDEDRVVHRCNNCDSNGRLFQGSGAGVDVDDPDPLENPSRFPSYRDLDENVRAEAVGRTEGPN